MFSSSSHPKSKNQSHLAFFVCILLFATFSLFTLAEKDKCKNLLQSQVESPFNNELTDLKFRDGRFWIVEANHVFMHNADGSAAGDFQIPSGIRSYLELSDGKIWLHLWDGNVSIHHADGSVAGDLQLDFKVASEGFSELEDGRVVVVLENGHALARHADESAAGYFQSKFQAENLKKPPLVKLDPKTFLPDGLTDEGVKALKEARDMIQMREKLFNTELKNLETIHHAGMVARLSKSHMFLYGPPGGAKSAFVQWLLKGEEENFFQIQLHQLLTEQAFIGGQNFEAAKKGVFEVNTKGSLADHTVALIDEIEKGNPATLASLLSLLNERKILAGNRTIPARLESLFSTSNSNLPEFFQQFLEMGQGPTAPALLNRFQIKSFVYNWLSKKDQTSIDEYIMKKNYLDSMAEMYPEVLQDSTFVEPNPINWNSLRTLAHATFKLSSTFMATYRDLVNDMRNETHRAIRESETRHQEDHLSEPFVYFPSADYSERLRQQIPSIILMSAFIDFLMSPLSNDMNLAQILKNPIVLDPLSLWRAYLVMTTLGPGHSSLVFNPKKDPKLDIDFGWSIDASSTRDDREEIFIRNLQNEQERFLRSFLKHIASYQDQIEVRSLYNKHEFSLKSKTIEKNSFEVLLLRYANE